ncbi:MAG: lipoyl synthase [Acidimicrobiia bacterium]|nr:lipoyl synthase [Acidimicrobiia bacterium]
MTAAVRSPSPGLPKLRARWLGRVGYREAWDLQRALFDARVRDEGEDYMLLVEHPHTYTCGRRTDPAHLLRTPEEYAALGAEVVDVDRGGDVTYHGPGQLVVYPIMRLGRPDVVAHVRRLEELVIATLAGFGIVGERVDGFTGVWAGGAKVCQIGCRVTRGVTMHGLALNVAPDPEYWRHIVPCGIEDCSVTSIAELTHERIDVATVARALLEQARATFGRDVDFCGEAWPRSRPRRGASIPVAGVRSLRAAAVEAGPDVRAQARGRPSWLKRRARLADAGFVELKALMRGLDLHTVCEEAGCPNIYECWSERTATFMILGKDCTRSCGFCEVDTAKPLPVDPAEPERVADAVDAMDLEYAVLTSVARDDLDDGGAAAFAACIDAIRRRRPGCEIEVLVPDFKGDHAAATVVFDARPDIFNHNLESVARLQRLVRPQAGYARSLTLLARAKRAGLVTKSGIICGMGETESEVVEAMADLRAVGCDILTIGQYLRPSARHLPVHRWVEPAEFDRLAATGRDLGFAHVESGPLVRSSYHARSAAASGRRL